MEAPAAPGSLPGPNPRPYASTLDPLHTPGRLSAHQGACWAPRYDDDAARLAGLALYAYALDSQVHGVTLTLTLPLTLALTICSGQCGSKRLLCAWLPAQACQTVRVHARVGAHCCAGGLVVRCASGWHAVRLDLG